MTKILRRNDAGNRHPDAEKCHPDAEKCHPDAGQDLNIHARELLCNTPLLN